ncbi:MAG: cohesin domain-containing protein [candidate division KSB1 bacterium]|nr:cohesin domain-containing protein [candidate division KSB1 bacterium]
MIYRYLLLVCLIAVQGLFALQVAESEKLDAIENTWPFLKHHIRLAHTQDRPSGEYGALLSGYQQRLMNRNTISDFQLRKTVQNSELLQQISQSDSFCSHARLAISRQAGRVLVVWQDERNGQLNPDVYAQICDMNMNPLGDNFKVHAADPNAQISPEVAAVSNNQFCVVWEDYRDGDPKIFYSCVDRDGAIVKEDTALSASTAAQLSPAVSASDSGQIVAAWIEDASPHYSVSYTSLDPDFKTVFRGTVGNASTDHQWSPDIAVLPDGQSMVIWEEARYESSDIYAQSLKTDGTKRGQSRRVNEQRDSQLQWKPSLAAAHDRFFAVWQDHGQTQPDVHAVWLNTYVMSQTPEITLDETAGVNPVAAVRDDTTGFAAWKGQSDPGLINLRACRRDGELSILTRIDATETAYRPQFETAGDSLLFCWIGESGEISAVYASAFSWQQLTLNRAPQIPDTPQGLNELTVLDSAYYSLSSLDPEGDSVYYEIDWGDGSRTGWQGAFASGSEQTFVHRWEQAGSYTVRGRAKDTNDNTSEWSEGWVVSVNPALKDTSVLSFSAAAGEPGDTLNVNLLLNNREPVMRAQLTLLFDPQLLSPLDAELTARTADFDVAVEVDSNELHIDLNAGFGQALTADSGAVLHIPVKISSTIMTDTVTRIEYSRARLTGSQSDSLPVLTAAGVISINLPVNRPPEQPAAPAGPDELQVSESGEFIVQTVDPEGDSLYYKMDWGDSSFADWQGPYTGGSEQRFEHSWSTSGTYAVRVRARDAQDHLSEWSEVKSVQVNSVFRRQFLMLGDVAAQPGDSVPLPVTLINTRTVAAVRMILEYDPDLLTPGAAQLTPRTTDFTVSTVVDSGELQINLDSDTQALLTADSTALLTLPVYIESGIARDTLARFTFKTAILVDANGDTLPVWTKSGSVVIRVTENLPPVVYSAPVGLQELQVAEMAVFTLTAEDPEGDSLYYFISWGDSSVTGWQGPYAGAVEKRFGHSWSEPGDYAVVARARDMYEHVSEWSDTLWVNVTYASDVNENGHSITQFSLLQNYPNPFNPSTRISYEVPQDAHIRIKVFDVRGACIRTLVDREKTTGRYTLTWNGRDERGNRVPSGVYIYRLVTPEQTLARKMVLVE